MPSAGLAAHGLCMQNRGMEQDRFDRWRNELDTLVQIQLVLRFADPLPRFLGSSSTWRLRKKMRASALRWWRTLPTDRLRVLIERWNADQEAGTASILESLDAIHAISAKLATASATPR